MIARRYNIAAMTRMYAGGATLSCGGFVECKCLNT
jgi:hypothetical protein